MSRIFTDDFLPFPASSRGVSKSQALRDFITWRTANRDLFEFALPGTHRVSPGLVLRFPARRLSCCGLACPLPSVSSGFLETLFSVLYLLIIPVTLPFPLCSWRFTNSVFSSSVVFLRSAVTFQNLTAYFGCLTVPFSKHAGFLFFF